MIFFCSVPVPHIKVKECKCNINFEITVPKSKRTGSERYPVSADPHSSGFDPGARVTVR